MNILLLGPRRPKLEEYLALLGDNIERTDDKLTVDDEIVAWADFLISFGYRHIIKPDLLALFPQKAINLHISYLPYNRGADPNLWSFLEDTPKGVTIHYLDRGLDTGDILAQETVPDLPDDTLRTMYNRLSQTIEDLFNRSWPDIRTGKMRATPQPEGGSSHRIKDRARIEHLLTKGWDTPVAGLAGRRSSIIS